MKNVVILGASGFVGYELYNMCKAHPNINLSALSANKSAGELVDDKELEQSFRYQKIENIDFENIDNNDWLVVNQFEIQGDQRLRRPDVLVFVNGLPLGVI